MSSFLSLYQSYLPPPTADTSLPRHHQISCPHIQTISMYYAKMVENVERTYVSIINESMACMHFVYGV